MSRNENAAHGARGADASNTCVECGTGIDTSAIDFSDTDEWDNTHHYDQQGEKVAVNVSNPTGGKYGIHCANCGDENTDEEVYAQSREMQAAMQAARTRGDYSY